MVGFVRMKFYDRYAALLQTKLRCRYQYDDIYTWRWSNGQRVWLGNKRFEQACKNEFEYYNIKL